MTRGIISKDRECVKLMLGCIYFVLQGIVKISLFLEYLAPGEGGPLVTRSRNCCPGCLGGGAWRL